MNGKKVLRIVKKYNLIARKGTTINDSPIDSWHSLLKTPCTIKREK